MKFFGLLLLSLVLAAYTSSPTMAQSATPQAGDACSQSGTFSANYKTGGNPDGNMLVCNGTIWVAFLGFNADASVVFLGAASVEPPTDDAHIASKEYVDSIAYGIESVSGAAIPESANDLDDLDDVSTSGKNDGDCLTYNNGTLSWEANVCSSGGVASISGAATPSSGNELGDLDDVSTSGSSDGDCLIYNNGTSSWEAAVCGDGIDSVSGAATPATAYLQIEDESAGAPAPGDCDSDGERGRLSVDTTNHRLYVCMGAARGWDYTTLTD